MSLRIACVQHGDFREATEIVAAGFPEPYFGMRYSVKTLESLFKPHPHLIVSLNSSAYREQRGACMMVGLPAPRRALPLPGAGLLSAQQWSRRIKREVVAFQPEAMILRTGNSWICNRLLEYAIANGIPSLVMMANTLSDSAMGFLENRRRRRLVALLNNPGVWRVGNHRVIAAASLVRAGVRAEKVISYDFPGAPEPTSFPAKQPPVAGELIRVVYAGVLSVEKGITDFVTAMESLQQSGVLIRIRIFGAGPEEAGLRARFSNSAWLKLEGRRDNKEVFEAMQDSTFVVVPSRHCFTEGMPFTLTEALASRTPVVASDHPVFCANFTEGEGLAFFRAGDPNCLASAIQRILKSPAEYAALSQTTANAYERVTSQTTAGELISEWLQHVSSS